MDINQRVRQVAIAYAKRVSEILFTKRDELQMRLKEFILEETVHRRLPACVTLENTTDVLTRIIRAYELAARGLDVEENLSRTTPREAKLDSHIDALRDWERARSDIASKADKFTEQELVKYLIDEYGVLCTSGIMAEKPASDQGLENEVRWIIYVATIILNKVVKDHHINL